MGVTFAYASMGGAPPPELELYWAVRRYGADAVFGRALGAREVRAMNVAANVYDAYKSRESSGNFAEWHQKNSAQADMLTAAHELAQEMELLDDTTD